MRCPSCGQYDIVTEEPGCLDWNGDPMRFPVCRNCDHGINDHTEAQCSCPGVRRCEATVTKGGEPTLCDRPLDDRGYCGHERSHDA